MLESVDRLVDSHNDGVVRLNRLQVVLMLKLKWDEPQRDTHVLRLFHRGAQKKILNVTSASPPEPRFVQRWVHHTAADLLR